MPVSPSRNPLEGILAAHPARFLKAASPRHGSARGSVAGRPRYSGPVRAVVAVLVALAAVQAAWAADGEPRKALTAKGNATARSIVLRRGDLSAGFTARKPTDDALPAAARCDELDESDLTIVGEAESPDFQLLQKGIYVTVGSTANVYRTPGDASRSWARGTSAQTTICLADIIRLSAPKGQRVDIVSAKRLQFPKVASRTAAFRVVATLTISGNRVRAYVDAIVVQHGRIQSGLVFTSLGRPVGRAAEVGLATVLAERMSSAAGPAGPKA